MPGNGGCQMRKKIYSIMMIVLTVIYVLDRLYMNKPEIRELAILKVKDNVKQAVADINSIKIYLSENIRRNIRVEYDKVKQSSTPILKESKKNSNTKYNISDEYMERLSNAAKKLSPIDQVKVNSYLEGIGEGDVITAINLMKDRLSDKEFEKIQEVYSKLN